MGRWVFMVQGSLRSSDFLDSTRGERVAENLLNTHVHCAVALFCSCVQTIGELAVVPPSGTYRLRCHNSLGGRAFVAVHIGL
jgi:hypothetical protein